MTTQTGPSTTTIRLAGYDTNGYYKANLERSNDTQTVLLTSLAHDGFDVRTGTPDEDYYHDIDFYVDNIPVSLKAPRLTRPNICLELMREDINNTWRRSWATETKSTVFLWVLPEGRHLWVDAHAMADYVLDSPVPCVNNHKATRARLEAQHRASNVMVKWLPVSAIIDSVPSLCYHSDEPYAEVLSKWLTPYQYMR